MIATRPDNTRDLASAFRKTLVHLWREGRLLCGKAVDGTSYLDVQLAIDAPKLVTGLPLCANCVRRFHRLRDASLVVNAPA